MELFRDFHQYLVPDPKPGFVTRQALLTYHCFYTPTVQLVIFLYLQRSQPKGELVSLVGRDGNGYSWSEWQLSISSEHRLHSLGRENLHYVDPGTQLLFVYAAILGIVLSLSNKVLLKAVLACEGNEQPTLTEE